MGEGVSADEADSDADQLSVPADHSPACSRKTGRRARKRVAVEPLPLLGEALAETVGHFFPDFGRWIGGFPEFRCAGKIVYDREYCIWSGISLFVRGLGSRRQFDHESRQDKAGTTQCLLQNLNRLASTESLDLLHGDTLNDYLKQLPPAHLESLPQRMAQRLIRMRVLEYARLHDRYQIVIDATGLWSWNERHCDACLHQTQNGVTTYYHLALEAKLITPDGMALSVCTEFIENADPLADKQDCERAAIPRMLATLKTIFPKLPICLLFDAAYANQTVFRLCHENGCSWIITFKEGSLPIAFRFAAFDCLTYNNDGEVVYFAWITNLPVRCDTVCELANQGGRKRWTIENQGFRNQKTSGVQPRTPVQRPSDGAEKLLLHHPNCAYFHATADSGAFSRRLPRQHLQHPEPLPPFGGLFSV